MVGDCNKLDDDDVTDIEVVHAEEHFELLFHSSGDSYKSLIMYMTLLFSQKLLALL